MKKMSIGEYKTFITKGTKTAHVATVNKDGSPHVVPVWFELNGDNLIFTTGIYTVKAGNILRDPRVCVSIDDPKPLYSFAKIEGSAAYSDDSEEVLFWATRIGGKYMGKENAELYGRRNAAEGEIVVTVTPLSITAYSDVAGW